MNHLIALALLLLPMSCAARHESARVVPLHSTAQELSLRADLYQSYPVEAWHYSSECDALLWESLTAIARNEPDRPLEAEVAPGKWLRRPPSYGLCSSDISRDMLTGLMVYAQHFRDLELIERLWSYGEANNWKMGEGDTRTVLTPSFVSWLADLRQHLGGPSSPASYIPDIVSYQTEQWFGNHLAMLRAWSDGERTGSISDSQLELIKDVRSNNSNNAFAQYLYHKYTDGDQTETIDILMSTYPEVRRTHGQFQCEDWRWQRPDTDWSVNQGCDEAHHRFDTLHTYADFLLIARWILADQE